MPDKTEPRKIKLRLVGLDGNAFALLGAFRRQARREGWRPEEIEAVTEQCMGGDYDNLLRVLIAHCEEPDDGGGVE